MNSLASLLATALLATTAVTAQAQITYMGQYAVPGGAMDLSGLGSSPNQSRLSFGSDLHFDKASQTFFGITDRGPGGGVIDFAPRVNQFKLDLSPSGQITNFTLLKTTVFKQANGQPYTGLNPTLATGNPANLGASLDPEGFVRRANGNFLVSDEYGPSIIEFKSDGTYVRTFTVPDNLKPRTAGGTLNYTDGRPTITSGRQDNRGFEGLTLSRDGKTAYAMLQDPLVNEGAQNDGRRSRNLRIVAYDVATGKSTGQFIYRLENIDDINARIPGTANDFSATNQGRSIGISSITAMANGKFLVIERDNRGLGEADPTQSAPVGSKRVYLVDLAGATDVSGISLAGSNSLPNGVTAVQKSLFLDVQAALVAAGHPVTEKLEGLSFGPKIDGGYALILATDNDFSVSQGQPGEQLDVCTSGVGGSFTRIAIGGVCPQGQALIPSYAYSFAIKGDALAAVGGVPEPATWAMFILGFGLVGAAARRSMRAAQA
ncbi:esterase-like activity of phytase family protein [Sandaracinobacteroides saxicola]|uniref:Esterase-like activity of phytase family protein n=1 Tax=Sandaracinobacteroides saxicola TaxID=2759707 RepID=A0A7G5II02_9SPHN|nr:esterase-like activity of phytase family protein [Sandaracinobacteroides saxicola]QMW22994.1 esterase-like activity of phytase family protein [Sandaracinobacteroides saxicola]